MNTSQLKSYAPQARKDFIQAVTARANLFGLSDKKIEPAEIKGDVAIIAGRPFPKQFEDLRKRIAERIDREGFDQVIESVAYTWFNRFVAIRYMELHDYLEHGYRVLSNRSGSDVPEILEQAANIDLPDLDKEEVIKLRLAGNKDDELYRLLIVAQCNALHQGMPFLFEQIGEATELLLPDNLLHSNSPIRKLANEIDEEAWDEVEVIGWIYQFYISEKKDQVIGKVVKSEDIPAATQLFTPNWIVKYMVQNSLGAQWLATYPQSPLKEQMEYYIEPAEQTAEVNAQLSDITPSTLNPEELTLIDPACGSGHILVEAYELFKAIYLERGYRQRDVAQLILEKNLFGLEICPRAAQLTGFALMMKGRMDDRRIFERGVKLKVLALMDSMDFDTEVLAQGVKLSDYGLKPEDLNELKRIFEHATTFGSLIQVSEELSARLPKLKQLSETVSQDIFVSKALKLLKLLVYQAELLASQYDALVANPPYMGSGYFSRELKGGLTRLGYQTKRSDLYVAFLDRTRSMVLANGRWSLVTRQDWMHTRSYGDFRSRHIDNTTTVNLVHLGKRAFPELSGEVVQTCCMSVLNSATNAYTKFVNVTDIDGLQKSEHIHDAGRQYIVSTKLFPDRFGSAFMYRMSANELRALQLPAIEEKVRLREGIHTGKNELFIRMWWEVSAQPLSDQCYSIEDIDSIGARWIPYNKGGNTRRWFFDTDFVIRFDRSSRHEMEQLSGHVRPSKELYFLEGGTWSDVSSRGFGVRYFPTGYLFDGAGPVVVGEDIFFVLALMNSKPFAELAKELMPNLHFKCGTLQKMPYVELEVERIAAIGNKIVQGYREECFALEAQRVFVKNPILPDSAGLHLTDSSKPTSTLELSYNSWIAQNRDTIAEMKRLEEENNRRFIDAYGLQDELTPDVPIEQITLTVNPAYRYGGKLTEEERWSRFFQDTMKELISYSIGCMMGRYSLDEPGLIYAQSGNEGFDPDKYKTFPADDDGIIPIMDLDWFPDDAANRFVEFLKVAWSPETLDENMQFVAESLGQKTNETPFDTVRRYLNTGFYKDHLKTYKKRPIYWLFSSGKQKAFECLVYLHRYNESTLARMRSSYVVPLQGKFNARLDHLRSELDAASTASAQKKIQKQIDLLGKKQEELTRFAEELRHYADMKINLDLDDGVKVNYGKFGNLLADKKTITGE